MSVKRVFFAALCTGFVAFATTARASLQLSLAIDGGAYSLVASGASGTTVTYSDASFGGDFSIVVLAGSSNSPGAPPQSRLNGSTLEVANNTLSTHTLHILVGDTGFTFPPTSSSVSLRSDIGGSTTISMPANFVTFQTWVNTDNGQNSMTGFTSGPLTPDLSTTFWSKGNVVLGNMTSVPFSMTTLIDVRLGAGGDIGFRTSEVVSNTPETTSLFVWGLLLGTVGLFTNRPLGLRTAAV